MGAAGWEIKMIKQKVGSYFETELGSCDIILKDNEKAIFIAEGASFSLRDLKDIIAWAEKDPEKFVLSSVERMYNTNFSTSSIELRSHDVIRTWNKIQINSGMKSHINIQYLWMSCDEVNDIENHQTEFVFKYYNEFTLCVNWLQSLGWTHVNKG